MVAVVTFSLKHLLAKSLVLETLGMTINVNEPPFAVGDEVVVLVEDVPQLPQHQLKKLRLKNQDIIFGLKSERKCKKTLIPLFKSTLFFSMSSMSSSYLVSLVAMVSLGTMLSQSEHSQAEL